MTEMNLSGSDMFNWNTESQIKSIIDKWESLRHDLMDDKLLFKMKEIINTLSILLKNSNYFENISLEKYKTKLENIDYHDEESMNLIFAEINYYLSEWFSDEVFINMKRKINLDYILDKQ